MMQTAKRAREMMAAVKLRRLKLSGAAAISAVSNRIRAAPARIGHYLLIMRNSFAGLTHFVRLYLSLIHSVNVSSRCLTGTEAFSMQRDIDRTSASNEENN